MEHERSRRPWVISGLALALMLAPALQAASLAGLRVLNFAPDRPWNYIAYGQVLSVAADILRTAGYTVHPPPQ